MQGELWDRIFYFEAVGRARNSAVSLRRVELLGFVSIYLLFYSLFNFFPEILPRSHQVLLGAILVYFFIYLLSTCVYHVILKIIECPKAARVAPLPYLEVHIPRFFHLLVFRGFRVRLWCIYFFFNNHKMLSKAYRSWC